MTTTSRLRSSSILLLGAAAAALSRRDSAAAQESERPDNDDRGYTVTLGAGAQFSPEYPGADLLRFYPVPSIGVRRRGDPLTFEAPDEGWGLGVLGEDDVFDFGPAIQFEAEATGRGCRRRGRRRRQRFRSRRLRRGDGQPQFPALRVEGRKGLDGA